MVAGEVLLIWEQLPSIKGMAPIQILSETTIRDKP